VAAGVSVAKSSKSPVAWVADPAIPPRTTVTSTTTVMTTQGALRTGVAS